VTPLYIDGIGVYAPGLLGWPQCASVLSGACTFEPGAWTPPAPRLLPPDARRRTTEHIRLALQVAHEAVTGAQRDAVDLSSVFASSESDGAITHHLCEGLARPTPEVSPTRFHNSVNNAPAGYWCIAVGARAPSTSIAAFDASFAAGLLEACMQVACTGRDVLLVVHDTPLPAPLHHLRPLAASFGVALLLAARRSLHSRMGLSLGLGGTDAVASPMADAALDRVRLGNPAARALPLLDVLAHTVAARVYLPYVGGLLLQADLEPLA
jgi:hypothetical protein